MKKRILTLTLSLILMLGALVVFSACGDEEICISSMFKYIDTEKIHGGKTLAPVASIKYEGTLYSKGSTFFSTVSVDTNNTGNTVYKLYSLKTLKEIATYEIPKNITGDEVSAVYFEEKDGEDRYIITVIKKGIRSTYYYNLMDHEGNVVFEGEESYSSYNDSAKEAFEFYDSHFVSRGVLYRIEGTSCKRVISVNNISIKSSPYNSECRYINGKYVYFEGSESSSSYFPSAGTITVFDSSFAFERSFTISDEGSVAIWLKSNKFLVLVANTCGENEKDYYMEASNPLGIGSIKVKLSTRLLDISDFTYTEIDNHPVAISTVEDIDGIKMPKGKTLVSAKTIVNKRASSTVYAVLNENGEIEEYLDIPNGLAGISMTDDGNVLLQFEHGTHLYTKDGKLIGRTNGVGMKTIGGGYFISESDGYKIYNSQMEEALNLKSCYNVTVVPNGTVFYIKYDEYLSPVKYMWKDGVEAKFPYDGLVTGEWGYRTVVDDEGAIKATYYGIDGNVIRTVYSTDISPTYNEFDYSDGCLIIHITENGEKTAHIYK